MRLAVRASSRATWSALETLSIKASCPSATALTRVSDRLGLGQSRSGIGVERLALQEDVDLEDRLTTKDRAGGRRHVLEGRDDRFGEDLGPDDHRVPDVDELLELFSLPAVEEGLRPRHVGDAADAYAEGLAHAGHADLHDTTGTDRQGPGRLGAEQSGARFVGTLDDPDGRVLLEVSVVQAEDANRLGRPLGASRERAGVEIDERQRLCSGYARDLADLAGQLVKAQRFGGVGLDRDADLAAGEARARTQGRHRLHGRVGHHVVRQRDLGLWPARCRG